MSSPSNVNWYTSHVHLTLAHATHEGYTRVTGKFVVENYGVEAIE